jgi:hypothetical protein
MPIKIVINYPQTEEGIQFLKDRQAEVVAKSLIRILSQVQMDELVEKLTRNSFSNASEF